MKTEQTKEKTRLVHRLLTKQHPDARIELNFSNPLELLVATILSAQCTDARVNEVTKVLFAKCKRPKDYLDRTASEIEKIIQSTGFFRQKAKSIRGAIEKIITFHGGEVPKTMKELTELPGVGRKTANVILGNAFDIPGLPVDTHVIRLTNRIGLTTQTDPVKIETEITALLPPKDWCQFSHNLIIHGRRVCKARKPLCADCSLPAICDYYQEIVAKKNRS